LGCAGARPVAARRGGGAPEDGVRPDKVGECGRPARHAALREHLRAGRGQALPVVCHALPQMPAAQRGAPRASAARSERLRLAAAAPWCALRVSGGLRPQRTLAGAWEC